MSIWYIWNIFSSSFH